MGVLLGLGAVVACLAAGGIVLGTGHIVIGIAVMLAAMPAGVVAWIKWNDRH